MPFAIIGDPQATATLNRKTLATYLQRSVPAIDRDNAAGRIPKPFRLGGALRWSRAEIDAWLAAGAACRAEWERIKAAGRKAAR